MNTNSLLRKPAVERLAVLAMALTLTVFGADAPAAPRPIPDIPLESGGKYPAPNIMFVLDDSGSMLRDYMPDSLGSGDLNRRLYTRNTLFYNPNILYRPWIRADNTRLTGGTTLASVYTDLSEAEVTGDIGSSTITYYVPKPGVTSVASEEDVYRYQIIESDAGVSSTRGKVVRSEWLLPQATESTEQQTTEFWIDIVEQRTLRVDNRGRWSSSSNAGATGTTAPANMDGIAANFNLPALGAGETYLSLEFRTWDGDADADLFVDRGSLPTTSTPNNPSNGQCRRETNGNSEEICTITNATWLTPATTWYFGVRADDDNNDNFRDVRFRVRALKRRVQDVVVVTYDPLTGEPNVNCSTSTVNTRAWRQCTFATPTGRSEADERNNFATWYSYHRTRMKVAKAGASEAFATLGPDYRVGLNSIWNDADVRFNIPVGTDGGLFANADGTANSNRTTWFDRLLGVESPPSSQTTPLLPSLQRTGEYFRSNSSSGPWGPGEVAEQLSCRQSFAILTTDGYWNNTTGYSSGTIGDSGDTDGANGPWIYKPDGITRTRYEPSRPYCDNRGGGNCENSTSNTLADVAMSYWKRDLRDDLRNDVPSSGEDPAYWQHMVTFGISIGLQGTLNPDSDLARLRNGSIGWPNPTDAENDERIDDLFHAAVNGRGKFVAASNPQQFQRGLQEAFTAVAQRQGSASNVTANSTSFSSDTLLFQASYTTGKWVGELTAFPVSGAGVGASPAWRASEKIADWDDRKVFTWTGLAGAEFPTSSQRTALDQTARINGPVGGTDNANYILGDQSLERQNDNNTPPAEDLRDREGLLGDIAHSSPFYVADTKTLFVGANDGMLHAFDASNDATDGGKELFAYVPGAVSMEELASLSDPFYRHRYFVDGPISVSSFAQTPNQNLLIGSLGRGGRALFGLDVSDPTAFDENDVLWEYDGVAEDDDNLGYVLGEPLIATLQDGTVVAIVGNGVNSPKESAVLYVINLSSGEIEQTIDTGVNGENGLFAPRGADYNGDSRVDAVYAGDLQGNLWKFDFSAANGTGSIAYSGQPMVTAADDQPITGALALGRDPKTGYVWVYFGTGSYIFEDDPKDDTVQSMYGVIDDETAYDKTIDRDALIQRDIVAFEARPGVTVRAFERLDSLPADKRGWFVDFTYPKEGERVVTRPILQSDALFFFTRIPPEEGTCSAGGTGFINAISAFSGSSTEGPRLDAGSGTVGDEDDYVDVPSCADVAVGVPCSDEGGDGDGNDNGEEDNPVGSISTNAMLTGCTIIGGTMLFCGESDGGIEDAEIYVPGAERKRASWIEIIPD